MKIFISWSKDNSTSHDVAAALHDWLPDVIQGVKPWMSTHDIQSGELWGHALSKELESNSYGILSITPASMHAPWLLFEAGALTKFVDKSRVCPYLSNMTATGLTGPLTQLQSRISDKEGTLKLVKDINKHLDTPMAEDRLQRSFTRCWSELEAKLVNAYTSDDIGNSKPTEREDRELLEEMLTLIRQMSRNSRSFPHRKLLDMGQKSLFDLEPEDLDSEDLLRMEFKALMENGASLSDLENIHKRATRIGCQFLAKDIGVAIMQTRKFFGEENL